LIEIVLPIPTNKFEPCSNWILSISLSKRYLRSCSNLLIFTNLRHLPLRNESTRAPSCNIYIINPSPVPKTISSSGTKQTMSSQEHLNFYILEKNGGCKNPHPIESCLSSRTLLFTTSFQTKFYHNIPLAWIYYVIDSIMKS